MSRALAIYLICACCAMAVGCAQVTPKIGEFASPLTLPLDEYFLAPGDKLSMVFVEDPAYVDAYRLQIGDRISLRIEERPELSGGFVVLPDGTVHFPLIAPVQARGLTLAELEQQLSRRFTAVVALARIDVTLENFNSVVKTFVNNIAVTNFERTLIQTVVQLNGEANFPLLGLVPVAGLTINQANEKINGLYQTRMPSLSLMLELVPGSRQTVAVLGEVTRPGAYQLVGTISLVTAIGLAGGWRDTAHLETVLLVRQRNDVIHVTRHDLKRGLPQAVALNLVSGDMVFVPKNPISDLNRFVDQYIRRNIPFNLNISLTEITNP